MPDMIEKLLFLIVAIGSIHLYFLVAIGLVGLASHALSSTVIWRNRQRQLGYSRLRLHQCGETVISEGKRFVVTRVRFKEGDWDQGGDYTPEHYVFYGRPDISH